jgi:hypothetical protein
MAGAREAIDSGTVDGLTSDQVLSALRPGLVALGFEVEAGKDRAEKIRRPVLFGDSGTERVSYEVDAVHDELGLLVEVEAGRGPGERGVPGSDVERLVKRTVQVECGGGG